MLQAANVPMRPSNIPPIRVLGLTNKDGDWLDLLEGGIFQFKSQWKCRKCQVVDVSPGKTEILWTKPSKLKHAIVQNYIFRIDFYYVAGISVEISFLFLYFYIYSIHKQNYTCV